MRGSALEAWPLAAIGEHENEIMALHSGAIRCWKSMFPWEGKVRDKTYGYESILSRCSGPMAVTTMLSSSRRLCSLQSGHHSIFVHSRPSCTWLRNASFVLPRTAADINHVQTSAPRTGAFEQQQRSQRERWFGCHRPLLFFRQSEQHVDVFALVSAIVCSCMPAQTHSTSLP